MARNLDNEKLVILIMQLSTMYKASLMGWQIKNIHSNGFTIFKKIGEMTDLDNDTAELMSVILSLNKRNLM
jgi:hypothetical protein